MMIYMAAGAKLAQMAMANDVLDGYSLANFLEDLDAALASTSLTDTAQAAAEAF